MPRVRQVVRLDDGTYQEVWVDVPQRKETDADRSRRRSSPDWQRKH